MVSSSPLWHIDAVGVSTPSTSACAATGSRNFYASCYGYSVAAYRNHTLRKTVLRNFFTNDCIDSIFFDKIQKIGVEFRKSGWRRKLPSQVDSEPDHANTDIALKTKGVLRKVF